MRDREWLPRQRRLVDHGPLALYRSIDRDDLAGANHDPVSDRDLPDRDFLDLLVLAAVGDPRSALEQRRELASCAPASGGLEGIPAAKHQGDHRASQVFAECQRTDHRHQCDRVDAHVSVHQGPQHRPGQRDQRQDDRRRPNQVARPTRLKDVDDATERKGKEDQADKDVRLRYPDGGSGRAKGAEPPRRVWLGCSGSQGTPNCRSARSANSGLTDGRTLRCEAEPPFSCGATRSDAVARASLRVKAAAPRRSRRWRSASAPWAGGWARPCVGASRIRVLSTAPLGTDFAVFNTRTLRRTRNPRVRSSEKVTICRDFMPEEGLEPPTRGL